MQALSVVVPMYNEQGNVSPFVTTIHQALSTLTVPWELICVDDGSLDGTLDTLYDAQAQWGSHVRVVALQRNYGQTAAMQAGIDAARGDIIVTMDGDLQNDPADIPAMIDELHARDLDMLQGWRKKRKDNYFLRTFPSRIANALIARLTGVKLHDYGCSLKVFRARILKQIRLFGEMHRFIPAWVASVTPPHRIGECEVTHHPRQHGQSKYGLTRTFRVLIDLYSVYFFLKFSSRPGHLFGYVGLWLGLFGTLIMSYLMGIKFIAGEDIGGRPLLIAGIFLLIASLQFLSTGVVAEMLSRVFFQASNAKGYHLKHPVAVDATEHWYENNDRRHSANA